MGSNRYAVASYDDFYDIIGVAETDLVNYKNVAKRFPLHSVFTDKRDALREAKRLSRQNGAFFVKTEMYEQYLIFRSENEDGEPYDFLTTRRAVAKALEMNQENGIAWETVDAVLEDYKTNKEVGRIIENWLDGNGILQTRDTQTIKKLKFYTQKERV